MTLEEIKARVDEIRTCADDPEAAHKMEDALYIAVLETIAFEGCSGCDYDFAAAALEARKINFPRRYA